MAKQVFLHIGLPKTATSRIQTVLQHSREALLAADAHYLQSAQHPLFRDNGHHILAVDLMRHDWESMQLRLDSSDVERAWQLAVEEIETVSASRCIISSEWFSFGVHTNQQIAELKARLQNFEVFVVIALRHVVGFANSLYAQRVRDGFAGTPADFVAETWPLMNWAALTTRWAAAFGADNVIALNFDAFPDQADPVAEFLRYTIGYSDKLGSIAMSNGRRNQALPYAAIELIRQVNASRVEAPAKQEFRDMMREFFDHHGGAFQPGHYFSSEAQAMLIRHCIWPRTVNGPDRAVLRPAPEIAAPVPEKETA